jgi:CBS domain-containing protein
MRSDDDGARARDIMVTDVITVKPETSVQDLARLLNEKRISGVPVVDDEGRVIGIVTESDLVLRVAGPHIPPHIELLGGIIYLENPHEMQEKLRKAMALTAGEVMTRDVVTVDQDRPVREIADLMVKRRVNRLPVVGDGRLVGIITRHEVISTLQ